jgi:hypothetical protein
VCAFVNSPLFCRAYMIEGARRPAFSLVPLLRSAGLPAPILRCDVGDAIFSADEAADTIMVETTVPRR